MSEWSYDVRRFDERSREWLPCSPVRAERENDAADLVSRENPGVKLVAVRPHHLPHDPWRIYTTVAQSPRTFASCASGGLPAF